MLHGRSIAALALASLALAGQAAPAMAQTAPTSAPAPDEASLAISRQIIAVIMPPDQRTAMVTRMQEAITAPMRASMQLPPELNDPGLSKMLRDYFDSMPAQMTPVLTEHMPRLAEAMAHAYARNFTRAELDQILAFAHSPAGGKYLSRSTTLMQDPDVAAVNGQLFRAGQEVAKTSAARLQVQIVAYLTAHPEIAKRASASGSPK